jgi:hypothetical protein
MATALMISDCNKINAINPFTATNTFGTPSNGGFYDGPDGTFVVERDETPMEMNDPNDDLSHFTENHINRSGPLYVNEAAPSPAPFLGYPARKMEFPDMVTTTWVRPGLNKESSTCPPAMKSFRWNGHLNSDNDILILLVLAALVYFVVPKKV